MARYVDGELDALGDEELHDLVAAGKVRVIHLGISWRKLD